AHSEGGLAEALARLWGTAAHRADFQGCPGCATGVAVSSALPPRTPGPDQRGVGREREQTPREVLHADAGWPKTPSRRNRELEPSRRGHRLLAQCHARRGVNVLHRFRSFASAWLRRNRFEDAMADEMR